MRAGGWHANCVLPWHTHGVSLFLSLPFALLVLVACPATEPGGAGSAAANTVGECKSSADAKDTALADTGYDAVYAMTAEVDGDDVILHMVDVEANCCPSPGATVTLDGAVARVDFSDVTTEDPCDCTCVFDFDVRVAALGTGTWTLDVYDDGLSRGELEVVIP